jgi:uncharacterized protein with GYD domain
MATYICLGNFTDQGIRTIKETTKRAGMIKELAQTAGVTVKEGGFNRSMQHNNAM